MMMGKNISNSENSTLNVTALTNKTAAAAYNQRTIAQISKNPNEKPRVWCDYCNRPCVTGTKTPV